mgnify:CR=1 FL=1
MIPLEPVVRQVTIQPRFKNDEFDLLLQYALRGVKEVCGINGLPKTVFLEVNDNNVAQLPKDYLSYSKVGVCLDGAFYTLGYNPKMCNMEKDCPSPVTSKGHGFYYNNIFLPENGHYGRVFGFGVGTNAFGEYNVNEMMGTVEFSDGFLGDPILEYMSSAQDIKNGTVMIDPLAEEALIAWIEMRALMGRGNSGITEIRDAEYRYKQAKEEYVLRKFSFTFDEFSQAIDYGYMQAPKH